MKSFGRIPTLDGWRGIAILLVIVAHAQAGMLGHAWLGLAWMDIGKHGVGIFFVLSGYLITARLLAMDKIDLGTFYLRRFFRLMPSAWLYLGVVGVLGLVVNRPFLRHEIWACLFFYRNSIPENSVNAFTSHFWSLSLEEQFYLVWPCVLFFCGRTRALYLVVAGLCVCGVARIVLWDRAMLNPLSTGYAVDGLLVGCILAFALERESVRTFFQRNSTWVFWSCVPVFCWYVYRFQNLIPVGESIAVAIMIACTCLSPGLAASKVLEQPQLKALGAVSYSVYMWQELLLLPHWGAVGLILLPPVSIAGYLLIERNGIRMGRAVEGWIARKRQMHAGRLAGDAGFAVEIGADAV